MQNKIAQVILPNLDPLDYLIPDNMPLASGDLVIVPLRSKRIIGMVLGITNHSEFEIHKLRAIEKKLELRFASFYLKFIEWIAKYYLYNLGHVFRMLLPNTIGNFLLKEKEHKFLQPNQNFEYSEPNFNLEQIEAIEKIKQYLEEKKLSIILDGVTGSGKTEVYLSIINHLINQSENAQILIMLPEIALTNQIINRVQARFAVKPHIWHSSITEKERRNCFFDIISGRAKIIIGARSALFLPYKNLSLIIVDEEHEQSYKQEDGVTYQARDMALMRANLANIPIILASASPSLESINNIALGKLNLVTLSQRYNENLMPKVNILDMKKERRKNYFIAPKLISALKENFNHAKQSLLFLNRKGYSPSIICSSCGFQKICNYCSTFMVYHKTQKKLKCHQCGFVASVPSNCQNCQEEETFIPHGPGVERVAEELRELIPTAKIITLTQDTFQNPKQAEEIINSIANKEYDIIIGTQIIAKGHHFPSLTLVGIIDADSSMSGGDLRAAEKTYQLLQQVGGRAGREINNSKVFIQTYNPEHPLILALASYNREKFIQEEMNSRQANLMPPFGRLASIILSSKQEQKLIEFAKELIKKSSYSKVITILGPAPALIYKIRSKFRYRILLKTKKNINIQSYINAWLKEVTIPSHIHLKIDIDPYYFL